jgi:hypothetical protein
MLCVLRRAEAARADGGLLDGTVWLQTSGVDASARSGQGAPDAQPHVEINGAIACRPDGKKVGASRYVCGQPDPHHRRGGMHNVQRFAFERDRRLAAVS